MTHRLSFAVAHDYSADAAIRLPVTLRSGGDEVRADAFVDTGQVRLGLVDHDGKLYLSGYEDEG